MADKADEKVRSMTVPALTPTAAGIAEHAEAVEKMLWDKERHTFKDPTTAMKALFAYSRLTALRLVDALARIEEQEMRNRAMAPRLDALEKFRREAEEQAAEAMKQFEAMVASGEPPTIAPPADAPPADAPPADAPSAAAAPPTIAPPDDAPPDGEIATKASKKMLRLAAKDQKDAS